MDEDKYADAINDLTEALETAKEAGLEKSDVLSEVTLVYGGVNG
jgi:hypothetical protein